MKIQKHVDKNLLLSFIFTVLICIFVVLNIKNYENEKGGNVVEIVNPYNTVGEDALKNVNTVEKSNNKISTKLGRQKLVVNSYYGVYDTTNKENGSTFIGLGSPVKENWVSVKPKKGVPNKCFVTSP